MLFHFSLSVPRRPEARPGSASACRIAVGLLSIPRLFGRCGKCRGPQRNPSLVNSRGLHEAHRHRCDGRLRRALRRCASPFLISFAMLLRPGLRTGPLRFHRGDADRLRLGRSALSTRSGADLPAPRVPRLRRRLSTQRRCGALPALPLHPVKQLRCAGPAIFDHIFSGPLQTGQCCRFSCRRGRCKPPLDRCHRSSSA